MFSNEINTCAAFPRAVTLRWLHVTRRNRFAGQLYSYGNCFRTYWLGRTSSLASAAPSKNSEDSGDYEVRSGGQTTQTRVDYTEKNVLKLSLLMHALAWQNPRDTKYRETHQLSRAALGDLQGVTGQPAQPALDPTPQGRFGSRCILSNNSFSELQCPHHQ